MGVAEPLSRYRQNTGVIAIWMCSMVRCPYILFISYQPWCTRLLTCWLHVGGDLVYVLCSLPVVWRGCLMMKDKVLCCVHDMNIYSEYLRHFGCNKYPQLLYLLKTISVKKLWNIRNHNNYCFVSRAFYLFLPEGNEAIHKNTVSCIACNIAC